MNDNQFNSGDLNQRIEVFCLRKWGTKYSWKTSDTIWSKVEALDKTNIFSNVGIGVKSYKFTIRKRPLTLHQAFRCNGRFYFLTDIKEINRMYLEVTAAQIEPKLCTVVRTKTIKNELNRPVTSSEILLTFPGCLTEKYIRYNQEKPQAINESSYVLVTPKDINLSAGELVKVEDITYNIQVVHSLDEYKNEYEISIKKDV